MYLGYFEFEFANIFELSLLATKLKIPNGESVKKSYKRWWIAVEM